MSLLETSKVVNKTECVNETQRNVKQFREMNHVQFYVRADELLILIGTDAD